MADLKCLSLGDENELLDLIETHTSKFSQPIVKNDPIIYTKKGLEKKLTRQTSLTLLSVVDTTVVPRSGPIVKDLRPETVNEQRAQMTRQKTTAQILDETAAERVSRLSRMVNHHELTDDDDSDNDDDAYLKQLRAVMKKD